VREPSVKLLVQAKGNFHLRLYGYSLSISCGRLKFPLADSRGGVPVEARIYSAFKPNRASSPGWPEPRSWEFPIDVTVTEDELMGRNDKSSDMRLQQNAMRCLHVDSTTPFRSKKRARMGWAFYFLQSGALTMPLMLRFGLWKRGVGFSRICLAFHSKSRSGLTFPQ